MSYLSCAIRSRGLSKYLCETMIASHANSDTAFSFFCPTVQAILTAEEDPCSACFVRFYHENFQRDKPDLLTQIKRATKGDQQSKDDVDSLRMEICNIKATLRSTVTDYDRKLAELSYECNRRITSMNAEYDKLASLVQSVLGTNVTAANAGLPPTAFFSQNVPSSMMVSTVGSAAVGHSAVAASFGQATSPVGAASVAAAAAMPPPALTSTQVKAPVTNLLHSLTEAAVSLHDESERVKLTLESSGKRLAPENGGSCCKKKKAVSMAKRNED